MDASAVNPLGYDLFIGLDVDKKSYSLTVEDRYNLEKSYKMPANPESFYKFIQNKYFSKKILYVYEAGCTGYRLHDYLTEQREQCFVISPNSIPRASNDKVKTNRIDSKKLCELLKGGLLKPIRVPQEEYRELRHLVNIRKNYARKQKMAKQQIEGLLLFENICLPMGERKRWSAYHIQLLKKIACSPATRIRLDALLMDLSYARSQMLSIHCEIRRFCSQQPAIQKNIEYLRSIPGIGFVIATYVLSRIGDPRFLKNVREIAAFAGIVPKERSTGDTVRKGNITHMGDETFRYLLVEASWIAIRKDLELKQFYHRIKSRHPVKGGSQIAIVGVARKLTHRIYSVLKEQRMYMNHSCKTLKGKPEPRS